MQKDQQSFGKYHRAGRQKLESRSTRHQGFEGPRAWKIKRHREVSLIFFVLPIRHMPIPYWTVSEVKKLSKKQLKRRREFLAISQHWVNKNWNSDCQGKEFLENSLSFNGDPWQASLQKLEVKSRPRL